MFDLAAIFKKRNSSSDFATQAKIASINAQDFLPAFSHYDEHTIISKDGELMQTICIDAYQHGLDYEPHKSSGDNLREAIRKTLSNHLNPNFSVWIHTLRKRSDVSLNIKQENDFAAYVNEKWKEKNDWTHKYSNSVYITIVYDGQSCKMLDKEQIKSATTPKKNRDFRHNYLEEVARELNLVAESVIRDLILNYRACRLKITKRNNIFYSEQMEFLSYLLNLRDEEVKLPDADISAALQSSNIMFGFNALETKNKKNTKKFGALLSLKQYCEVPAHTVDMLLQAPVELIISQAFHFVSGKEALQKYQAQKELFEMSNDKYSIAASGLADILNANRNLPNDFVTQQTTIIVLADELQKIDEKISSLQKAFSKIGLIALREDIRMEEIFWSIFPGNMIFMRRKNYIPARLIGGFAKLNRFPSGEHHDVAWKEPIALLPTLVNSPYFFNFHVDYEQVANGHTNGHTLLIDFNSFDDKIADQTLDFLLTQASRLKPRIYYFDYQNSANLWFDKMHGDYRVASSSGNSSLKLNSLKLNPFSLDKNPRNIAFLTAWCCELISATSAITEALTEEEKAKIKQTINKLYNLNSANKQRSLADFVNLLAELDSELAERFAAWLENGIYSGLFSGSDDNFSSDNLLFGIDLSDLSKNKTMLMASFAYMIHRVAISLDDSPAIIILKNAESILEHDFFAARLESLLEMLSERNAILIACVNYSNHAVNLPAFNSLISNCASQIIIPDDNKIKYSEIIPELLSKDDQDLLHKMHRAKGDFLLKQKNNEIVALRVNLDFMPEVQAVYKNDIKNLSSLENYSSGSRESS